MSEYRWVSCGQAAFRLELFGEFIGRGQDSDSNEADGQLISIAGIRLRNYIEIAQTLTIHEITRIDIEEMSLDEPILLRALSAITTASEIDDILFLIDSIPQDLILEGIESPDQRFLDLVAIKGWKLEIRKDKQASWYLLGDWEFDTHPDYFPGATIGEVSIVSTFAGIATDALKIEMPWPLSTTARLSLQAPARGNDGRWEMGLVPGDIPSIFDGAGAALKNFVLGKIDLVPIAAIDNLVRMRSGMGVNGEISFDIIISVDKSIPFVEFGGQKLVLTPGTDFILTGIFGSTHLSLGAEFVLKSKTGFSCVGQLTTPLTGENDATKEIVSLIGVDVPSVKLNFRTGNKQFSHWVWRSCLCAGIVHR